MKRALLLAFLCLPACGPLLSRVQGTKSTLTLAADGVTFANLDTTVAGKVVVDVDGPDKATFPGGECVASKFGPLICNVGDMAPGGTVTVSAAGITNANASWKTPDGQTRGVALTR